jgi:hypothetical protein
MLLKDSLYFPRVYGISEMFRKPKNAMKKTAFLGPLVFALSWLLISTPCAAAQSGPALALDGLDDYASSPDNNSLDLGTVNGQSFTLELFFYVPNLTDEGLQALIYKQDAYALFVNIHTNQQDQLFFRIWSPALPTPGYVTLFANPSDLAVGWHHAVAELDNEPGSGADAGAVFLDGHLVGVAQNLSFNPGIGNSSSPLYIGAYAGVNPFHGWIDEVRLSDVVRYWSDFTVPTPPFTTDANTRALWHFDETPGSTTFLDQSPNGNVLTAANGAHNEVPVPDTTPPTVLSVVRLNPTVQTTATNRVVCRVTFSEHVNNVSTADFTLAADPTLSGASITSVSASSGSVIDVTIDTGTSGEGYLDLDILVPPATITDDAGNALTQNGGSSGLYYIDHTPPTVTQVRQVSPNPREDPVQSVDVIFSESIDLSSFTFADLSLTRNGTQVQLSNTLAITALPSSYTYYRISGLQQFTAAEGNYTLTVNAAGIKDLTGNSGVGSASNSWTTITRLSPTVTGPVGEGQQIILSCPIAYPPSSPYNVQFSWGDGSYTTTGVAGGTPLVSTSHIYQDDNPTGIPSDVYNVGVSLPQGYDAQFGFALRVGSDTNSATANAITVATNGDLYVVGTFYGIVDFDPGPGIFRLTNGFQSQDIFVLKLDQSGNFIWAKYLATSNDYAYPTGVALDSGGNVYVLGDFRGTIDFDPGLGVFNLTNIAGTGSFLWKLNSAGDFVWARCFGGTNSYDGLTTSGLALDSSGNAYITGGFQQTVNFDPSSQRFNLTTFGQRDIFLAKLDRDGNLVWATHMGNNDQNEYDFGSSLAIDPSGSIYVSGAFNHAVDFDPGPGTFYLTNSFPSSAVFLEKLDSDGHLVWARIVGPAFSYATPSFTTLDSAGNVYVESDFSGTNDFDPGPGTAILMSSGGSDVFISKFNDAGTFVWAKSIGGSDSDDHASGISADSNGNIYLTGTFTGTADFDPGPATFTLTSDGPPYVNNYKDIFLTKLDGLGNFVWAKKLGGAGSESVTSLALNSDGAVLTVGYFYGISDFDPGTNTFVLTNASVNVFNPNAFISKLVQTPVSKTVTVMVTNVPPLVMLPLSTNIALGEQFAVQGSFSDPGIADTFAGTVNYGDTTNTQPLALGTDHTFALAHIFTNAGTFPVLVTVVDDDGGIGTRTLLVTVAPLQIAITTATNSIVIEWPNWAQDYLLEQTPNLSPPISWLPTTNVPVVAGDQKAVVLGNTRTNTFFRLKKL